MTKEQLKELLNNPPFIINISELERAAEVPKFTVSLFKRGYRDIPEKSLAKVVAIIQSKFNLENF